MPCTRQVRPSPAMYLKMNLQRAVCGKRESRPETQNQVASSSILLWSPHPCTRVSDSWIRAYLRARASGWRRAVLLPSSMGSTERRAAHLEPRQRGTSCVPGTPSLRFAYWFASILLPSSTWQHWVAAALSVRLCTWIPGIEQRSARLEPPPSGFYTLVHILVPLLLVL
jgi:hypothetical protein